MSVAAARRSDGFIGRMSVQPAPSPMDARCLASLALKNQGYVSRAGLNPTGALTPPAPPGGAPLARRDRR